MKLVIITGEESGDVLGASLMDALNKSYLKPIELYGIGGKELENILGFTVYRPWANVDKKQIIESYQEQQIENLIPLTRSCISLTEDECKKCFWCKEREWAIG